MNITYIASHIKKIQTKHANKPKSIENSLWRIADNANLFCDGNDDNLNRDGTLTEEQKQKVWEFIEEFQSKNQNLAET